MPFTIVRQDITKMQVDAVVNAANTQLMMGGGVCGAIFNSAGAEELSDYCRKLAPIKTGGAVITPGFALNAKYIIHAAGPVYNSREPEESERLLRSAYTEALKLALKNQCSSIAFPLISSGIYGYPKKEALEVAVSAIRNFLEEYDMDIYLAVFDMNSYALSEELLGSVESYIDENYVREHDFDFSDNVSRSIVQDFFDRCSPCVPAAVYGTDTNLDDIVKNLDEPFHCTLLRLIDSKGKTDTEVYKGANIDRKLFSKIRTGNGYMPGKRTVLALAVSLELTLKETDELLKQAGYALSHSRKFDVIVEYFIINKNYDIFAINEVLFKYDQPLLGSC